MRGGTAEKDPGHKERISVQSMLFCDCKTIISVYIRKASIVVKIVCQLLKDLAIVMDNIL